MTDKLEIRIHVCENGVLHKSCQIDSTGVDAIDFTATALAYVRECLVDVVNRAVIEPDCDIDEGQFDMFKKEETLQ